MSVDNVKAFWIKMQEDEELAKKVHEAITSYTGDKAEMIEKVILPIAAQEGFHFDVDHAHSVISATAKAHAGEELSEDELEMVAGGKVTGNDVGNAFVTGSKIAMQIIKTFPGDEDDDDD